MPPFESPKNAASQEGNHFSLIRILCVLLWASAGIALLMLNGKPFFNALLAIGCLVISAIAVGLSSKTVNPTVVQKIGTTGSEAHRTTAKSTWIVFHLVVVAMLLSMLPSQWSEQQRRELQIERIERFRAAGQE